MTCTITIPWPPSKTSSNKGKQGNWWEKAGAAKSYKATCAKVCLEQKVRKLEGAGNVEVTITYHFPTEGRQDWDNLAGRAKQGWDAIADAIGIDDGKWWPVHSVKGEKVKGGAIVVVIEAPTVMLEHRGQING